MTIDMTLWRRAAACLVAGIGALLALAWVSGDAHATAPDRELRAVLQHSPPGAKVISPTRVEWPRQGMTVMLKATKADAGSATRGRCTCGSTRTKGAG